MSGITATALFSALAGIALAANTPQIVGIASAVLNEVRISSASAPQTRRVGLRERVALADRVQTGLRSQLQILLLDKSVFSVGANARLTIDRYVYDPNSGRLFSASVAKGAFRFMSGQADRRGSSSINTPVASIGIRGTIVDGVVGSDAIIIARSERGIDRNIRSDPDSASLVVLRGPGQQTQGNTVSGAISVTAGGKTVELDRPMLATYVPSLGAAPVGPFTISPAGLARINALVFPAVAARRAARDRANRPRFQFQIGIPAPGSGGQEQETRGGQQQPPDTSYPSPVGQDRGQSKP